LANLKKEAIRSNMISFSPSEEQQMIINTVREFAVNEMRKLLSGVR